MKKIILLFLFQIALGSPVTLRLMLISWPLSDGLHPVSNLPIQSVDSLLRIFERENPDIRIKLLAAHWGSGATGFMPKSRALLLSRQVDVIETCTPGEFANQGTIENIESWIKNDPTFDTTAYFPGGIDRYKVLLWSDWKIHRYCLPIYMDVRLTGYDRDIFEHFGVDTLSTVPTPQEILEKARKLTGIDPVTGKQVYGIFFLGTSKNYLLRNAITAFNGRYFINDTVTRLAKFTWVTKENIAAVEWIIQLTQYGVPAMFSASDEFESVWGTSNNYAAIRLQAYTHSLYYSHYVPGAMRPDGSPRFRYVNLFHSKDGGGGLAIGSAIAVASCSQHKEEAWRLCKWLSYSLPAQRYIARNINKYPVIREVYRDSIYQTNENFKNCISEITVPLEDGPYSGNMTYAVENELDKAFVKARDARYDSATIYRLARECLQNIQTSCETYDAYESQFPRERYRVFSLGVFAKPFFAVLLAGLALLCFFLRNRIRQAWVWFLFLLPSFFGIFVFLSYPIAESFRLSMHRSNGFLEMFAGLENYRLVLTDPNFYNALYNTFYLGIINMVIGIPIGLIFASLINSQKKAQTVFKVLYFLPMVTSIIASVVLFRYIFNPTYGLVNATLGWMGFDTSQLLWLNSPGSAKIVVVFFSLWIGTGSTVILCLAGLQAIPDHLYEAATIDGANALQKWRYITLPGMRPVLVFLAITGTIGALKRFEDVFTLGGMLGSPARSLQTAVGYIFEQAFAVFNFGAACAAAYLLFFIILAITILNYRTMLRKD